MPLYCIKNLKKEFSNNGETIRAIEEVYLDIYEGEFLVIMGPSGSGKSTLLNILTLLETPANGTVEYKGEDIFSLRGKKLTVYKSRVVGFVFQDLKLLTGASVWFNILLPRLLSPFDVKEGKNRAQFLLNDMGIEKRQKSMVERLSVGEMQRVAVARAFINEPEVIFADEPTGNLDSERANEVLEELHKYNSKGKTIILVTHNDAMTKYADRVVHLENGFIKRIDVNVEKNNESINDINTLATTATSKKSLWSLVQISIYTIRKYLTQYLIATFSIGAGLALFFLFINFIIAFGQNGFAFVTPPAAYNGIEVRNQSNINGIQPSTLLDKNALSSINSISEVKFAYPVEEYFGSISINNKVTPFYATNASPIVHFQNYYESVSSGSFFNADNENSVLLTSSTANLLGFKNPSDIVGQTVGISVSPVQSIGNVRPSSIVYLYVSGILSTNNYENHNLLPFNWADSLDPMYSYIYVYLQNDNSVNQVKDEISKLGYSPMAFADQFNGYGNDDVIASIAFALIALLAIITAIISTFGGVMIIFKKRALDIGLLRFFGMRLNTFVILAFIEGIIFGLLITLASVALTGIFTMFFDFSIQIPIVNEAIQKTNIVININSLTILELVVSSLVIGILFNCINSILAFREPLLKAMDRL